APFGYQCPSLPERDQRGGQPETPVELLFCDQPLVRCAIVGVLQVAAAHPVGLLSTAQPVPFFSEHHAIRRVRAASEVTILARGQPLLRILSNGFQLTHPKWLAVLGDPAPVSV